MRLASLTGQTGRVVLITAGRRIGVMPEAMLLDYGGSSEALLGQSFDNVARGLARFLVRLARDFRKSALR